MENKEEIVIIEGDEWKMTMIDAPDYTDKSNRFDPKYNFEYKSDCSWGDHANVIHDFINNNLKSALKKDNVEDLTEDEKFAIAHSAGVRMNNLIVDDKFRLQTEKCGIIKDGDKWVVLTKDNGWISSTSSKNDQNYEQLYMSEFTK